MKFCFILWIFLAIYGLAISVTGCPNTTSIERFQKFLGALLSETIWIPNFRNRIRYFLESSKLRYKRQNVPQINIHVTAPLFTARLYEYGIGDGDKVVPATIDVGMRFELQHPINFYGQKYKEIFILSNGGIGFEQNSRNYKQNVLRESSSPLIVALWNRNDLRKGGQIFFREITSGRAMERGQSEIRYQYDYEIVPISTIIISWVNMQPFGEQKLENENTNTVQLALINTDNGTFANFIYKQIAWSFNAEAGFSRGDKKTVFSLPNSGTESVVHLKEKGNTGIPGEWMFKIDGENIVRCKSGTKGDVCDEECSSNEWGLDCDNCCQCSSGKCHPSTGQCESNQCKTCWANPPLCNQRDPSCPNSQIKECGLNAMAFTDRAHCSDAALRCQCLAGFNGDGYNCTDINECHDKRICGENSQCVNTLGGYVCECRSGFIHINNKSICLPDVNFKLNNTINLVRPVSTNPNVENVPTLSLGSSPLASGLSDSVSTTDVRTSSATIAPKKVGFPKFLPKETNAHLVYKLSTPIKIFGRFRDILTVWSTGVVAIGQRTPMSPTRDISESNITGFAPFFDKIDLGQHVGDVFIGETIDPTLLTQATNMVKNHSQTFGFVTTSMVTVTYQNVTSPDGKDGNTFELVLMSGYNTLNDNVTYAEFVYNKINWIDSAKAMILHDDPSLSIDLLGPEKEDIKQLDKLSNIVTAGEWVYRVDKADKLDYCFDAEMAPPLCDRRVDTEQLTQLSALTSGFTPATTATTKQPPKQVTSPITSQLISTSTKYHNPLINFENNGETITFPPFITLLPQLVTRPVIKNELPSNVQLVSATQQTIIKPIPSKQNITNQTGSSGHSISTVETTTIEQIKSASTITEIIAIPQDSSIFANDETSIINPISSAETTGAATMTTDTISTPIVEINQSESVVDLPPLKIFTNVPTVATKRTTRPPIPIKPVKPHNNLPVKPKKPLTDEDGVSHFGDKSRKTGHISEAEEDLNSTGKLAVIIPAAIVSVWIFILVLIGTVVCIKRRSSGHEFPHKYDPSAAYLQSMNSHPAAVVLQQQQQQQQQQGKGKTIANTNGYPTTNGGSHAAPYRHENGGHSASVADKDERLTEMYSHSRPVSRSGYSSTWNHSSLQQPYGYYNQGFFDSYPDTTARHSYRGHY